MILAWQSSLRSKLVHAIMLPVGLALFLAVITFLVSEVHNGRMSAQREMGVIAEMLGEGSITALETKDAAAADRVLSALRAQNHIVEGTLYDAHGAQVATYRRGPGAALHLPVPAKDAFETHGSLTTLTRTIRHGSVTVGRIHLRADATEQNTRLQWLLIGGLAAAGAIVYATFLFARRLSGVITQPILHLADAAQRIAAGHSTGECVVRESKDEVGALVDAFNAMLSQLVERQSILEESQRLAHLGNWTFDPATRLFRWSEETFHIFGLDSGGPSPDYRAFRRLFRADDFKRLAQAIRRLRTEAKPLAADFRLMRRDDVVHWVHVTAAWFKDAEDRDVIRGTVMDITDRKQAEAALLQGQKLESLGVLAGGIAHDFNNLLAALRANLDLARTQLPNDSRVNAYVAKSEKIIERAANLTRQLLAYSGRGQFQVKPLDLSHQVKEMGHLLSVSVSKKAELRYQVGQGLPAIIGDTSQIQQVIMNLVINASEALDEQGGYVRIRTSSEFLGEQELRTVYAGQSLAQGPYVALEVEDNGHGMDARTMERIFDPFFTTKFQGRGLGLAAMLGIVKSHNGGIKVESEVGRGTTFKVLFPSSSIFLEKPKPAEPSSQFNRSGKVLIVDDEPDIRHAAAELFEYLGLDAVLAADGVEALEQVKAHRGSLRLVLLDLMMPRMNGAECLKALRAIDADVPVLMTSGYTENEITGELPRMGLSGFLQKPYSLSALKAKMREVLGS